MDEKKCRQCGKCCRSLSFYINPMPSIIQFYKARGCIVKQNVVHIPCICPQLDVLTNKCDVHKTKPDVCKFYGTVTTKGFYVPDGCGYADREKPRYPGRSDGTKEVEGSDGESCQSEN